MSPLHVCERLIANILKSTKYFRRTISRVISVSIQPDIIDREREAYNLQNNIHLAKLHSNTRKSATIIAVEITTVICKCDEYKPRG